MEIQLPQPSVSLYGLRIDEPVTALTDLLVSGVCLWAYLGLARSRRECRTILFFRYYFLMMCLATFLGGVIGHAFLYQLSFAWKLPGWVVSMFSVALIERSSIEHAREIVPRRLARFFLGLNIVELLTVMSVTLYTLDFGWVEFHSGYGLLGVVLPFHLFVYWKKKDQGSLIIAGAVLVASAAALVYMNKLSLHTWFNYYDISHTLMAAAACVFYQGAGRMRLNDPSSAGNHGQDKP